MRSRNGTTRQRQPVHKPLEATTTTMPARRMLKMREMRRIGDGDRDETMDDEAVLEYEALMEKASMAYK